GSFHAKPPPGYTFIPAGDPQITNRCKQLARLDGAKVFIVSTTRNKHADDLAYQVHRIGYHFPSSVVGRACTSLGIDISRSGQVLRHHVATSHYPVPQRNARKRQSGPNHSEASVPEVSQAAIDTQAREAIRDMFPKIPQQDLRAIVTRAFEKDRGRVGTAPELSLPRRVQLAVVAHIRHVYTDYDKLLKQVQWNEARALVEKPSLDKLAEWRADDDDDPNAMEEILREVIVIPDDEDDEEEIDHQLVQDPPEYADRQASVEIVASCAIAEDLETRAVDYGKDGSASRAESPDSDNVEDVRFLGHGQYALGAQDRRDQTRNQWMGAHRQRAWEQARDRHRNEPGITHRTNDHFQSQQFHGLSNMNTESVNQGAIQERLGESRRIQRQPSVYKRDDTHDLQRTTLLPAHTSKPHVAASEDEPSIQVQRQQPQYFPLPLADKPVPRHVETYIASPRKHHDITHGSNLSNEGARTSRENIQAPLSLSDPYAERASRQAANATIMPRPERAVQSIEGPSQLRRINVGNSDSTTSYFTTSEPYHIRLTDHESPLSQVSSQIRKGGPGFDENLNYSKRRRAPIPDGRVYEQFQAHPGQIDTQRSFLVPVDQPQFSGASRWSDNLQPIIVENRPVYRHQVMRPEVCSSQNSTPLYVHAEKGHGVARIRTDPLHHSQVFLSNGLSHSDSRSVGFQRSPDDESPKSLSAAYGSSDSYACLQRDAIVTSRSLARDSKPGAVEYTNLDFAGARNGPAIGQASQVFRQPPRQALAVSSSQNAASQVSRGQFHPIQPEQQQLRLRRTLPLERSFENEVPAKESIRYEYRPAPPSIRPEMEYHPANSHVLERRAPEYPEVSNSTLLRYVQDKDHGRQAEHILYNKNSPLPQFQEHNGRRYA
ncbi:MAG: hypothetical protein Q9187_007329, partial [Circinaria calcarea]